MKDKGITDYQISEKPGKIRLMCKEDEKRLRELVKAVIKAKVERGFLYIKHIFGFRKVRYLGLAKNHAKLFMFTDSRKIW